MCVLGGGGGGGGGGEGGEAMTIGDQSLGKICEILRL